MSKNIKIFLIDNDNDNENKNLQEIEIEKPKTLEELKLILEQKINNFPNYYNLFYKSDEREINIQNNDQYLLFSSNILFIREANLKENAGTIFKKSIINNSLLESKNEKDKIKYENDEINKLIKEIKEKEKIIEENNKYIDKTIIFFNEICKKLQKMHLLIIPEINNLLENLIKEFSSKKILKSFNEIMDGILEEIDTLYQDLIKKLNINSINEEIINENKKGKNKTKYETKVKEKTIVDIKDKTKSISKTEIQKNKNLPYSCIPRIGIKDFPDISYDNLGPK